MATRLYGLSRGEVDHGVSETTGSATSADHIELTIDLAVSLSKQDVLEALDTFKRYIIKGNWAPA